MNNSEKMFEAAKKVIPGGVNSPVRAFGSVGLNPKYIDHAKGPYIYDVDGNEYIDYICSWGPMILGHANEKVFNAAFEKAKKGLSFGACTEIETEIAELIISGVPNVDMIRMVNSGTEAVMSAIRLARGYTGKDKIIKFEGCYHGHSDSLLVKAGSGLMTTNTPMSDGVTKGATDDTLLAVYNDLESVEKLLKENTDNVACVIVEPVAANMGVIRPAEGFLEGLRSLCDKYNALLIFDEVITGFRLAFGGAQEYFGVDADLVTFGKIIGAGMPVGAYGGRREIMEKVSPSGTIYQAGTLSGNPVAMAAGLTQLTMLHDDKSIYEKIKKTSDALYSGMAELIEKYDAKAELHHIESLGCIFFKEGRLDNYDDVMKCDTDRFAAYFRHMLENGVHLGPSQFESMFVSSTHDEKTNAKTLAAVESFLQK